MLFTTPLLHTSDLLLEATSRSYREPRELVSYIHSWTVVIPFCTTSTSAFYKTTNINTNTKCSNINQAKDSHFKVVSK